MPEHLAETMLALGREFDASVAQIVGDGAADTSFPLIHAVGQASTHRPVAGSALGKPVSRSLYWAKVSASTVAAWFETLSAMRLMKRHGRAATVLGLARLIASPVCRCGCGYWWRRWKTRSPATLSPRRCPALAPELDGRDSQYRRRRPPWCSATRWRRPRRNNRRSCWISPP